MSTTAFWSRVEKSDACWLWHGYLTPLGYGRTGVRSQRLAHRFAYESVKGLIPDGLELDHLCRVRNCVNPDHLEPVTHAENHRRRAIAQTHCRRAGHEFTPANTGFTPAGKRRCRRCDAANSAAFKKRRRAMMLASTNGNVPDIPKPPSVPIPRPKAAS